MNITGDFNIYANTYGSSGSFGEYGNNIKYGAASGSYLQFYLGGVSLDASKTWTGESILL